ncbi:MAG: hypothetical protein IKA71_05140 [Lentisphaeria bacterium]|nr:hypothetical protein [Lentisphaeria bacterium]
MNKITAAEVGGWGLRLYFHDGNKFHFKDVPFSPFVLLTAAAETPPDCNVVTLAGGGSFCRKAVFASLESYERNLPDLKKRNDVMLFRDLLQQALGESGVRLFAQMDFSELRQMSFAVNAGEDGEISGITLFYAGNVQQLSGSEAEVITQFNSYIKSFDPDVLCGFNICRSDLPLLVKRAKCCKIPLDCGRDGKGFAMRASRFAASDKQISYNRYTLAGRHVVDLIHVLALYDAVHRDLEDFEPDTLEEYFGVKADNLPELAEKLSAILMPAYFYRTRVLPLGYQDCILRGSGIALDALLTTEYIRAGHAVPVPEEVRRYTGALSGAEAHGFFENVCHCDVRSLYPSLLLMFNENPARDELGIFLKLLNELRTFRLAAKDRMRMLPPGNERDQVEALQSSFKVLINSFYGYLGFAQGCFNDYNLAEKVTAAGRELLGKLTARLSELGAKVIEMDTDGIYFQYPSGAGDDFTSRVTEVLPPGIDLDFDACYQAMYSYKAKNYALLQPDDSVILTGAALKSRSLEPFQRKFIAGAVDILLHGGGDVEVDGLYRKFQNAIEQRELPLEDFAKSEVLSDSPENYARKLSSGSGRRSAAYELVLASGKKYRAGDRVRFYVTGTKAKVPVVGNSKLFTGSDEERDENTAYYLAKLEALKEMFVK